ncbi:MAG: KilA-N domain protein [Rhodocyclales bacterium]|nr:KilA-N domain protein [Rhodocyclales bacterium]
MKQQYELDLIPHHVNGSLIDQRASDGFINATALCKAANKQPAHYFETKGTKEFLAELGADLGIPISGLIQTLKGGSGPQGTWVHPQVAVHLGQWVSPKFAVQVSKWVTDWMSGNGTPVSKAELPVHLKRYLANDGAVPPGYFSILQETGTSLFGPLHMAGFDVPAGWVPDISVGLKWCAFLRDHHGHDTDVLGTYKHDYMDGRPIVDAKLYPDALLPEFRRWFREHWLPENGTKYFKGKDPASLSFLNQIPAIAGPRTHRIAR